MTSRETAMQHFAQVYTGQPFTGTPIERELIMIMLTNSQGSVGLEEALCDVLKLKQTVSKHGFDAIDEKTQVRYELKPSMQSKPTARYNDLTPKKIDELNECKNVVVFETHFQGRMIFLAKVNGKHVATLLQEKFIARQKSIEAGKSENKGSRQSHGIYLNEIVARFGKKSVEVVYYFPSDNFHKPTKKLLGLNAEVNNL
jgi:hypothetical protein